MMNITYTHGNKVWRFAAVPHDADADLDVSRLCVSGAANDVARKSLADYIQLTDEQKIINTTKADPLTHFVARAVWAVIAPTEPVPVTARWTVPELGAQELFIPCGELSPDPHFYTIEEWALEALMSKDWNMRYTAIKTSTSERVHLLAMKDEDWEIREIAAKTSTSERVHLLALKDEHGRVRYAAAQKSTSERVHLLAMQDEHMRVCYAAAQKSTSERVHLLAMQNKHWQVRKIAAQTSTSKHVHLIALQDENRDVRYAAKKSGV